MITTILFDMDGVLIDAREWHFEALNRALALFGYHISKDAHLTTFDGLPTRKKLNMLSDSRNLPRNLHGIINELKQNFTTAITYEKCKPTFNHKHALMQLNSQGYKLGVCSNSIRKTVETMMDLSGLDEYLQIIFSNEDVANPKPDPEMYIKAMEMLKVTPRQTLILEDNDHGIQAAIESGAHILRIGDPSQVTYQNIKAKILEVNGQK